MKKKDLSITFLPDGISINVPEGTSILDAAIWAGIYIQSICAGQGTCAKCKVIVRQGKVKFKASQKLSKQELEQGYSLACSTLIESDCVVEVPKGSRLESDKISQEQVYTDRLKNVFVRVNESVQADLKVSGEFVHSPLVEKIYLELVPTSLKEKRSDLEIIYNAILEKEGVEITSSELAHIRNLGKTLRNSDWKVTVSLSKRGQVTELLQVEAADTRNRNFGVVFDIGTTTVSGELVDLNSAKPLGRKAARNRQSSFGTDIISRIIFAQKSEGLCRLHETVVEIINDIIDSLCSKSGVSRQEITCCLCAGNPTMIHLLLKIDPTFIRREPYVPVSNFMPVVKSKEAGILINPAAILATVPSVASYVGGDIVSGILSCRMHKAQNLSLLIDIGTNGEIALGNRDWFVACAASAGPAFEGSGVSCGMHASEGAIQKVSIDPKSLECSAETISGAAAVGICGSGYIDLLSQMLDKGIIDRSGKINYRQGLPFIKTDDGNAFIVVKAADSGTGKPILITDLDIENLKRSKAAIFAAVISLVNHIGLDFENIDKVFIAGGFGTFLDIESAVSIGLLPDIKREKFLFVGNSSLRGALEMILSKQAFAQAADIASKVTYFELSVDENYMQEYSAALFFPHTDISKFPTFKKNGF